MFNRRSFLLPISFYLNLFFTTNSFNCTDDVIPAPQDMDIAMPKIQTSSHSIRRSTHSVLPKQNQNASLLKGLVTLVAFLAVSVIIVRCMRSIDSSPKFTASRRLADNVHCSNLADNDTTFDTIDLDKPAFKSSQRKAANENQALLPESQQDAQGVAVDLSAVDGQERRHQRPTLTKSKKIMITAIVMLSITVVALAIKMSNPSCSEVQHNNTCTNEFIPTNITGQAQDLDMEELNKEITRLRVKSEPIDHFKAYLDKTFSTGSFGEHRSLLDSLNTVINTGNTAIDTSIPLEKLVPAERASLKQLKSFIDILYPNQEIGSFLRNLDTKMKNWPNDWPTDVMTRTLMERTTNPDKFDFLKIDVAALTRTWKRIMEAIENF